MRDAEVAQSEGTGVSETLADLLAEFQQPGQPLHGMSQVDAERVFVQVVEQLVLRAVRDRRARRGQN